MALETISIEDPSGAQARVLPELGFNCYQWQVPINREPRELLWFDPLLLEGKAKPTRSGIPILFPFAGRIRGTQLTFEGHNYDIADTLDDFGNPIHGFVLKRRWRVVEKSSDRVTAEFQPTVDDPAIASKWPADYRLRVSYQISAATLRSDIEVYNPDSKLLPFGFGSHPYFRMPLGNLGDIGQCELTVPARYRWELDDKLLPLHELCATPLTEQLNAGLTIGSTSLDDLLTDLAFEKRVFTAAVSDPRNQRSLSVTFGNEFANCVVFIPPHREALCIEPYTTAPDAFRLQTLGVDARLRLLGPGSTWRAWFEMRLS
jgi:aldose 1-epimerase